MCTTPIFPDLTDKFHSLYESCPTLFEKVLPRSDSQQLNTTLVGNEEEEIDVVYAEDEDHKQPSVIGRMLIHDIKKMDHAVVQWVERGEEVPEGWGNMARTTKLPLKSSATTEPFHRQLIGAYWHAAATSRPEYT